MSDTRKLVLIDAYSLLFRAYFSSRALSTSDGRPTGALFGLSNMLFTLIRNEKPDAIIVCWDAHQRTHRKQAFEDYKAHRPDTDADLKAQMFPARDLVAAFGVQSAELGGYEADDLIGTLAERGLRDGYEVEIITGDSDQLQLVKPGITVQITQKGVTDVKRYDRETVIERYGVPPERIPDWKGLVGDASDNIPGVPGIGDKTATALLQKFETVDGILEHLEEVTPPRIKTILETHREKAIFSRDLATIVCDAPFEDPILPYDPTPEVWSGLRAAFADLEFKSLLRYIPSEAANGDPLVADLEANAPTEIFATKIVTLDTEAEIVVALKEVTATGRVGLVLETDTAPALKAELRGIAFAASPETCYYVPLGAQAETDESNVNLGNDLGGPFRDRTENFATLRNPFAFRRTSKIRRHRAGCPQRQTARNHFGTARAGGQRVRLRYSDRGVFARFESGGLPAFRTRRKISCGAPRTRRPIFARSDCCSSSTRSRAPAENDGRTRCARHDRRAEPG